MYLKTWDLILALEIFVISRLIQHLPDFTVFLSSFKDSMYIQIPYTPYHFSPWSRKLKRLSITWKEYGNSVLSESLRSWGWNFHQETDLRTICELSGTVSVDCLFVPSAWAIRCGDRRCWASFSSKQTNGQRFVSNCEALRSQNGRSLLAFLHDEQFMLSMMYTLFMLVRSWSEHIQKHGLIADVCLHIHQDLRLSFIW